jgi:hypothetical protein
MRLRARLARLGKLVITPDCQLEEIVRIWIPWNDREGSPPPAEKQLASVQVPDDLHSLFDLNVSLFFPAVMVTAAAGRPRPGDLKAVAVPLVP